MSGAEETRARFEVSVCTMDDRYFETPDEERECEIQFREGAFIFVSLLALMLNINFLRTEIAWFKANYTEHIPLHVYSISTPLIVQSIELFLNKFARIYNNFFNIYRIEDFSNKHNISSILIKIKNTQ